eukprot:TRINITY_DN65575_c6_g1_i3.p1 TRINITY_DN65575_c6_g1~~TRINITY_DN65575_c6_g1_i3.p1  ORF type:complete len:947 (-),score=143.24 TRINITY_DN65575_c6_g1_i3:108-2906(-)
MATKPEVKKKLLSRSERVKCIDMHPKEPWMLCSLYSGQVHLWDYEQENIVKSFEIVDLPVRCVKFIARQSWFICGSDDMCLRVFNFNTMEKVACFEAHQDYIRGIAVHDSLPYVLSCSDDMTVKLWDWSKGWQNQKSIKQVFEGHTHYVMGVVFNPKDPNTFATASLDRTIKVWNLSSVVPNFTLEGHEKGINCVEYYPGPDKPYLISGSDDRTVRIWDYQTKTCIQTLYGHVHNITTVLFHPDLPLIVTGSEDESVKVWAMSTYRLETSLDFGLERVWTVSCKGDRNRLAIGCDKGSVVVKLGKDTMTYSMDQNGKIIIAANRDILQMNVKNAVGEISDGEKILLPSKELGTQESQPKKIEHNPNGQFVAVISEGEYVVNTALAWRPKTYGECIQFVWSNESGGYAVLESSTVIKIFKNFKPKKTFNTPSPFETIFGGPMLAAISEDAVQFFDWDICEKGAIRKIAARPKQVYWNENSELCCLVCDTSIFILRYNREAVNTFLESGEEFPDEGIDDAFELVDEVEEKVRHGAWIGDCFLFTNRNQRLNYYIGGEVYTLAILDRQMYLLGYVPKENRVFLTDKERNVVSYQLYLSVIEYQTAIVRGDIEGAQKVILPKIPKDHRSKVAQFLDGQQLKEIALEVTTDDEHKFDLAIQLQKVEIAQEIAKRVDNKQKWKRLGDAYLKHCNFVAAAAALKAGEDLNGLLLLYHCTGNKPALQDLAAEAEAKGKHNVAFMANYLCSSVEGCTRVLTESDRFAEAVIFKRSYDPQNLSGAIKQWKTSLGTAKVASCIPDPVDYPNLFPNLEMYQKKTEEEATAEQEEEEGEEKKESDEQEETKDETPAAADDGEAEKSAPPAEAQDTETPKEEEKEEAEEELEEEAPQETPKEEEDDEEEDAAAEPEKPAEPEPEAKEEKPAEPEVEELSDDDMDNW